MWTPTIPQQLKFIHVASFVHYLQSNVLDNNETTSKNNPSDAPISVQVTPPTPKKTPQKTNIAEKRFYRGYRQ